VASVFRAKDADDAIRIGTTAVWMGARPGRRQRMSGERFINDLESGMVFINRMVASDPRIPFGGVKWSGARERTGSTRIRNSRISRVWIEEAP